MPGWFDLYDWPIEVGATDDRAQKLSVGVAAVRDAIRHLQTAHNIPLDKIVVGGFSQGGAVALLAAYHPTEGVAGAGSEENPSDAATPLAGCAMLSGWLTLVEDFVSVNGSDGKKIASAATLETKTPLFWGHGRYDDKVLFDHQEYGVKKLQEFGVKTVDARQYSIGHESTAEELQALAAFVDEAIFSSTGSSGIEASASFSGKDLEL